MKKRLTVLALAFAMVLTMSASVFAAGQNAGNADASAQGKDASATEAKLVKYLQMPEGLNDPGETFNFTFTPQDSTNTTYGVPASAFTSTSATIASADMTAVTSGNAADTGNKVGTLTIARIFYGADSAKGGTGDNADYPFPAGKAGEYNFKVAETAGSNTDITYSTDKYMLKLIVDNTGNIDDVTVQEINTDPTTGEETLGEKVNPADDNPTDNPDDQATTDVTEPDPSDSNGGFTFTNNYSKNVTTHDEPKDKNPEPDPQDPDNPAPIDETNKNADVPGAFVLDKKVLGEYGDQSNDFEFTVTVNLPKLNKSFSFADANAPAFNDTAKGSIKSGSWADGVAVKVNLKHDGQLKFPKLPVGTKVTVSEADVAGYTKVWTTSQDGVASGSDPAPADVTTDILVTEDAGGYAICRNSFDDTSITPTGIIINNLPYVLLIGLALGGIVLFSRKRRYE